MSITDEIRCTVDGCGWSHSAPPLDERIGPDTLASVFGPGVFEATAHTSRLHETEQAIAAHMRTHEVVEFLRTITRLRADLADAVGAPSVDPVATGPAGSPDRAIARLRAAQQGRRWVYLELVDVDALCVELARTAAIELQAVGVVDAWSETDDEDAPEVVDAIGDLVDCVEANPSQRTRP